MEVLKSMLLLAKLDAEKKNMLDIATSSSASAFLCTMQAVELLNPFLSLLSCPSPPSP